jgi:hypothetical protein
MGGGNANDLNHVVPGPEDLAEDRQMGADGPGLGVAAGLLEPVGVHEPRGVVVRCGLDGRRQGRTGVGGHRTLLTGPATAT